MPTYELVPALLLHAAENASSVQATSTDEDGEAYGVSSAAVVAIANVPVDAVVILPLSPPLEDMAVDFSYVAASSTVFVQLHDKPQERMTYGQCMGYSAGPGERPAAVGALVKFPSQPRYLVAKPRLLVAIRAAIPLGQASGPDAECAKRPCIRQLVGVGEQAEDSGERAKGTSNVIVDLDGGRHATRTKTDISQREKDLYFVFRAMDHQKQDHCISPDVTLQPEEYRNMICEQYETQSGHRHEAFAACSLVGRVQRLYIFRDKAKLKLLLTGSILMESSAEPSLTLDDFVTGEAISNKTTACPNQNRGLVGALKNFQMCLHILLADAFENALEVFLDNLEGVYQPMEMVASDLLKFSVESSIRKFFRVVRSSKGTSLQPSESVQTPEKCAMFLTTLFDELCTDLSNHQSMTQMETFFRFRQLRRVEMTAAAKSPAIKATPGIETPKTSGNSVTPQAPAKVKSEKGAAGDASDKSSKPCAGHLGGQLGATRRDGQLYECRFGKDCIFGHVSIAGKTNQKLVDIAAGLPSTAQADIKKAIAARK